VIWFNDKKVFFSELFLSLVDNIFNGFESDLNLEWLLAIWSRVLS